MRNDVRFFVTGLLGPLLGTFPGHAQAPAPAAAPRFYVGGHLLYRAAYQVFYAKEPYSEEVDLWQLTAGGNVTPRLAVQLGLSYRQEYDRRNPYYAFTLPNGDYMESRGTYENWTYVVPLLARYAVVPPSKFRLQVEALAGVTVLGTKYRVREEDRVNGQVVSRNSFGEQLTQGYYTVGAGVRCPFGRRVEGVFDWTYSRNVRAAPEAVHRTTTGNRYGLTRALSVGVRYRFDVPKKPAAL